MSDILVRYLWLVRGIIVYFFIKSNVNETHKYREGGVAFISSLENIYPIFGRWYSYNRHKLYFNLGAILGLISYNLATCKLMQRSEIFRLLCGLQNNVGLNDKVPY